MRAAKTTQCLFTVRVQVHVRGGKAGERRGKARVVHAPRCSEQARSFLGKDTIPSRGNGHMMENETAHAPQSSVCATRSINQHQRDRILIASQQCWNLFSRPLNLSFESQSCVDHTTRALQCHVLRASHVSGAPISLIHHWQYGSTIAVFRALDVF